MISKAVEIGRTVDDHKGEKKGMGFRFMKQQQQKGTLPFKTGTTKNGGVPGGNVPSLIRIPQEIKKVKEDSEKKLLCEYSDGAEKNQPYIVRLAVNQAKTEVLQVDVLYFANTKTEPANGIKKEPTGSLSPEITELPATLTGSTISISSY